MMQLRMIKINFFIIDLSVISVQIIVTFEAHMLLTNDYVRLNQNCVCQAHVAAVSKLPPHEGALTYLCVCF